MSTLRSSLTRRATGGRLPFVHGVAFSLPKRRVSPVALAEGDYTVLMHSVYILRLRADSVYIGIAASIRKRFTEHQRGGVSATKNKRPIKLI